jgi:MerR family copper efflux transcriptional regulator
VARKKRGIKADGEELFSTGDVMKRSGLSRQVLYQYTTMGLIKEAATTDAGYRLYPKTVFRHLEIIRSLNEIGYTLRDIRDIFAERLQPS